MLHSCSVPLAQRHSMYSSQKSQASRAGSGGPRAVRVERNVPNPKLKLMEQVREVMRLKHYSIRTERCYCDWIRRYVTFHGMQCRADLEGGKAEIERFLSDLAVRGK